VNSGERGVDRYMTINAPLNLPSKRIEDEFDQIKARKNTENCIGYLSDHRFEFKIIRLLERWFR
jgi:hypothetical protein